MVVVVVSAVLVVALLGALVAARREQRLLRARALQLQSDLEALNDLLKRRGDLANEVAHEIKNPITAILCSAETLDLLLGESLDSEHRKSLRYICDYGDEVLRLLSDYLDVSRVEAGITEGRPVPTDVHGSVEAVKGLLRSFAQRRGVEVLCADVPAPVWAEVDPRMLKQIIFNLLHNAIKFSPPGGVVEVTFGRGGGGTTVDVGVRDYGPGIEPAILSSLFNPHALAEVRRRAEARRDQSAGYGLGLALVKMLVELSGGVLLVDSEPGLGSYFTFSLPATPAPSARDLGESSKREGSPALSPVNKPLLGQTFLLVDGDPRTPETVLRLIEAWGGVVDRVSEASEALQALAERRYDAVMIDDPADGVEGSELARTLREEGKADKTTIILASVDPIDPELAKDTGADRYIAKPFTGHILLDSLLKASKTQITH